MKPNLSERASRVLEAIILGYIETGGPVGSRTVVSRYKMPFSPATVRNEMAGLTRHGLVDQAHVSSGRSPSPLGIRYYLDHVVNIGELPAEKKALVRSMYPRGNEDYRGVARASSRALASLTRYTGVVWAPGIGAMPVKHVEFIPLSTHRMMAVIISASGFYRTSVFGWNEELSGEELNRAADYINKRFTGRTLVDIREEIIARMKREKREYDKLLVKAMGLMNSAIQPASDVEEVFIDGQTNLVHDPEFADIEKMKAIFKAFEQKGIIVKLLGKAIGDEDVRVLLSSEEKVAKMPNVALIMAPYGAREDVGGGLGVIGPIRMDYRAVIPLVKYTAHYVSSLLSG